MAERSVAVRLSAEVSGYIAQMTRAGAATQRAMAAADRSVAQHSRGMRVLAGVGKYTGIAVAGGFALAIKEAADFNEKMALVQTLSHANQREMQGLRAAALHVGTAWGYTATQVSDGEAELVKAGVSLKDVMGGGLRGTLALAAAGQTDVATATTIAAAAMTEFRLKGKDLPHVADLLAAGADKALGSVTDLGFGLGQAGTTAHQLGLSIEQTTGTLAAFANAGLIGERGGTTFKQMMLQLANPTHQAKDLMDKYGVSLYKANGQIKTMPELADNLKNSFERLTPAQRNAALGTIFGSRAIQGANILMAEGGKGIANWIHKVNDQGFAAQQARGKLNSLNGDLLKLKAQGVNALIDLGTGAQSPLRHMVQGVTQEIHKLTADGSFKRWGNEAVDVFSTVVHGAAPVLKLGEEIVSTFNKLPGPLKSGLATVGAVAFALRKTPIGRTGGLAGAAGGALGGRGGVVPVFVTNAGFGGPGGKTGVGGTVLAGEGGAGRLRGLASRIGGAINIPNIAAGILTVQGVKNAGSPLGAAGAGAAGGAFLGGRVGGVPGAVGGAVLGGLVGIDNFTDKTQSSFTTAMKNRDKNVKQLVASYRLLQQRQKELHDSDSSWVPPAALINADKMRTILHKLGTETGLSGKRLHDFATGAQRAGMGTKSAAANFSAMVFGAHKAGVSSQELAQMMHKIPSNVLTQFLTPGAVQSKRDVKALAAQFGLTPKQVKILLKLLGFEDGDKKIKNNRKNLQALNNTKAKPKVEPPGGSPILDNKVDKNKKNLNTLNNTKAKPKVEPPGGSPVLDSKVNKNKSNLHSLGATSAKPHVELQGDGAANAGINSVRGNLASLNGDRAVTTIETRHITTQQLVRLPSLGKPRVTPPADGAFFSGSTRQMADGGIDGNGVRVPRTSQMLDKGKNNWVLWHEPETGWEAYISGKPGMRARNLSILSMAAERLGASVVAKANGGITSFKRGGTVNIDGDIEHYAYSIKGVTRELNKLTKELQNTRQARNDLKSSVQQAYTVDPFQGTLGGFDSQVRYQTKRIQTARKDLTRLTKHGLDATSSLYKQLAASGNVNLLDQFARLTPAQLEARRRSFGALNRADLGIAGQVSSAAYQTRIVDLTHEVKKLTGQIHALRKGKKIGGSTTIHKQTVHQSQDKKNGTTAAQKLRHR